MNAAILDDEIYCSETLFHLLAKHCPQVHPVTVYADPETALEALRNESPDILFLDVEMPFMTGFDFIQALGPTRASIIFTTAHDVYAVQAFKVNAIDYLLKPIDKEELIQAVRKVEAKPQPLDQNLLSGLIRTAIEQQQSPRKIAIHTVEGIHLLMLEDIIYCRSEGSYSYVHLRHQTPLMVSKNLAEMEEMIHSSRFFRIHKSFLINQDHILKVNKAEGGDILMSNQESVPISRHRRSEFFDWLAR